MFLPVLAGAMLVLFIAVWVWQNPGTIRGRLQPKEIAQFLAQVEKLPFPKDDHHETLTRLREWLERDDGKPFYMLNLMRYYAATPIPRGSGVSGNSTGEQRSIRSRGHADAPETWGLSLVCRKASMQEHHRARARSR
jgi:hypothetical protein